MHNVFISYAWRDNVDDEYQTHEARQPVSRFRHLYYRHLEINEIPHDEDFIFFDRERDPGEFVQQAILEAIRECTVMLAFFSPAYFNSRACFDEWREFHRLENEEQAKGESSRILIPVQLRELPDPATFHSKLRDEDGFDEWLADVTGPYSHPYTSEPRDGRRFTIDQAALLSPETRALAEKIEGLSNVVQRHIDQRKRVVPGHEASSNVLVLRSPIVGHSLASEDLEAELAHGRPTLKYAGVEPKPVCVIYAGGTIGMVHQAGTDPVHSDFEMAPTAESIARYLRPRLASLPYNIHFFALEHPIDSSNVRAANWLDLARLVREIVDDYQGIVILHGTNTITYTASALAFLLNDLLTKPVVLTGSEVPISVLTTDAIHNIENAIRAAAPDAQGGPVRIPEVCLYWSNELLRGCRATKKKASDRAEGFHTPNMAQPLAHLSGETLEVNHSQLLRPRAASTVQPELPDITGVQVAVMFIYPEMDLRGWLSDIDRWEQDPSTCIDGLVLLSYSSGNVPDDEEFTSVIRRLLNLHVVIVNVTQCPFGRVELKLFETSATLFDLGVVDGYDMTLEAAYTKLVWSLARLPNRHGAKAQGAIRQAFQRNQAGEMSASIQRLVVGRSSDFKDANGYRISDSLRFPDQIDPYDITNAFLRIEGMTFADVDAEGEVRIFFGLPGDQGMILGPDQPLPPNLLASFRKEFGKDDKARGWFDKNLEITGPFRKFVTKESFQLTVAVIGQESFGFSGMSVVVYTQDAGR